METKYIKINYSGSGIITLRIISYLAVIACTISAIFAFSNCYMQDPQYNLTSVKIIDPYMISLGIGSLVIGFMFLGIGLCVASIAECSLYQKEYIKNKDVNIIYKED